MMTKTGSSGFTLIEVLIAAILGLIMLGGVIAIFLSSKQSFSMQNQLAVAQTDGRFALAFIERYARNAGWFDGQLPTIQNAIDFSISSDGGAGGNDEISFVEEVLPGTGIDCNGAAVAGTLIQTRFFVNGTTLFCEGNGTGIAQPLIENVESFQVLYGVDLDNDGVVNSFQKVAEVIANSATRRVSSVQIGILVATQDNASSSRVDASFDVLGEPYVVSDKKLRRLYIKTYAMPNQIFSYLGK